MSSFTTPLVVTPIDDKLWRVLEGFCYYTGTVPTEYLISVPAGFVTDFASVPRPLWWLLPPWGNYGKAAVVHDWLYQEKPWSRRRCDQVFLEGMQTLGVSWKTRTTMYSAVRLAGWIPWGKPKRGQAVVVAAVQERVRIDQPEG